MARARWQTGSIRLENKHNPTWVGRFLVDEIDEHGQRVRRQKSVRLGTKEQLPTERLARRELQRILEPINSLSYKPTRNITFEEAIKQWTRDVVRMYKPASRASISSNTKKIIERFGSTPCSQLSTASLQAWITYLGNSGFSSKTIRNYMTTFQMLWNSLKAWEYVTGNPFDGVKMPRAELKEQPSFSPEQVREILSRAEDPYRLIFWICAECGLRGGEVCGLFVEDLDLDNRMIYVKRSAYQGKLQTTKTGNAVRAFPISESLARHIQSYLAAQAVLANNHNPNSLAGNHDDGRPVGTRSGSDTPANLYTDSTQVCGRRGASMDYRPGKTDLVLAPSNKEESVARNSLLFTTPRGCPYDNGNVVKRGLKPILRAMGIDQDRAGLHAFRHSNCSAMDSLGVPERVRMDRIGHGSIAMTMRYTHSNSHDHRIVADALGALFAPPSSAGDAPSRELRVIETPRNSGDATEREPRGPSSSPSADSHTESVQLALAGD